MQHLVIGEVVKLPQAGLGLGVAQQVLGRHDHERLAELAVDLAPQQVEIVGGRRAVGDLRGEQSA